MESVQQAKKYEKPLPEINNVTKPFWDYCKAHELRMQYCTKCNEWIWYPKAWCPYCGARSGIEWRKLSGQGTVYSFTVIRQVIDNSPAFQSELPFVIALVELEEGPRIYSNVQEKEVEIGDRVSLYFDDASSEISLPKFKK